MKVTINTEHCVEGIQKASSITPAKSGAAMLRTLWLRADKASQTIAFMATDASTEFIGKYPAEVEEEGLTGVPSKAMTDLLRSLPSGVTSLETDASNNSLLIKQGKRRYKLPTSEEDWFQEFSTFPEEDSVVWSGEVFLELIDKTIFCISDEEASPLGCMLIRPQENDKIDFCGLDGNKFAQYKIINDALLKKLPESGILIQKKYLADLRKLISDKDIEINFDEKRVYIRDNNGHNTISIPLIKKDYPNYSQFISKVEGDECSTIELSKKEISDALSRILIFNTKEQNCVYINIASDEITVSSNDQTTGSATEPISAVVHSSIKDIAFITKSLLDIFQRFSSDKLVIRIASEAGPCSFQTKDDNNYLVIAMPMRIINDTYYEEEEV